ncbi:LOW QUALITY PROTEIN: hypothetical protein CVT26_011419 [Gymnopilus dilepis]|uniref:Uncharacterized protein n=1 Tax=Gymnopilus dilepis TaxID=231916 RepID=A0A409W8X1_9AGAR|nr:LOW QUALITY PROTEIN: hypothetical protein CVT26_011419 [Gymnopilus dilepis]
MIRLGKDNSYIYEPITLLDDSLYVPFRWFTRGESFHVKAWVLEAIVCDDTMGQRVRQDKEIEVSQQQLLKNMTKSRDRDMYNLPHPSQVIDPAKGNRWRELAKGHRVVSLPLWMYCDDTSGNTSKMEQTQQLSVHPSRITSRAFVEGVQRPLPLYLEFRATFGDVGWNHRLT